MATQSDGGVNSKIQKIFLEERGYGSEKYGESTIIADSNGEPMTLRHVIHPDKSTGGQLIIVRLDQLRPNADPSVNRDETVYEIRCTRTTGERTTGGSVRIRQIDALTMDVQFFDAGYFVTPEKISFINGCGMRNPETAIELLEDVLSNAFYAALQRASAPRGAKLYYGKIANLPPIEKKWYDKKTQTTTNEKPKKEQQPVSV